MKIVSALVLALFVSFSTVDAKLAPERWGRATEEERHQLTRGERYFDQKQFENAAAEYELFLQLYGKSEVASYAQLMFAECTRRRGQVNTAMDEFRNVVDYFPDSPDAGDAQYSIGVCLNEGGDAEKAAEAFEKVIAKWPKTDFAGRARDEACVIYWRTNQREKWLGHMEYLATGEYADTQNLRIKSQRRLLMHLLAENKIPEAFAVAERAGKKDAIFVFADWSAEALRSNELIKDYGEPVKKSLPGIATATVAFIEKSDVSDPVRKLDLDVRSARILAAAGVIDKANERYATLVKSNSGNDSLRSEYAQFLRSTGKRDEARLVYRELTDGFNADRQIAETYAEEKNWKRALEDYQAMLNKYPDKVSEIQWRLGEFFQQSGKYPEAIAAFQQSQREPQALFRIAECQGQLKQNEAAIQTLVGIVNFFKSAAPEAQYRIADCYAASGDKEAAIRTLKLVCKTYLNSPWAGRAHEDLSHKYSVDVTLGGASKKKTD